MLKIASSGDTFSFTLLFAEQPVQFLSIFSLSGLFAAEITPRRYKLARNDPICTKWKKSSGTQISKSKL